MLIQCVYIFIIEKLTLDIIKYIFTTDGNNQLECDLCCISTVSFLWWKLILDFILSKEKNFTFRAIILLILNKKNVRIDIRISKCKCLKNQSNWNEFNILNSVINIFFLLFALSFLSTDSQHTYYNRNVINIRARVCMKQDYKPSLFFCCMSSVAVDRYPLFLSDFIYLCFS